jgi:hypothetical protein
MDVHEIISELRTERKRLDDIIQTLERLTADEIESAGPKRRGRKSMDIEARQQVSRRMKRYWAQRRKGMTQEAGA